MATILDLDALPTAVRAKLHDRAFEEQRTIQAEAAEAIVRGLDQAPAGDSDFSSRVEVTPEGCVIIRSEKLKPDLGTGTASDAPSEADNAEYCFPRPLVGKPILVTLGGEHHPTLPIILEEAPE